MILLEVCNDLPPCSLKYLNVFTNDSYPYSDFRAEQMQNKVFQNIIIRSRTNCFDVPEKETYFKHNHNVRQQRLETLSYRTFWVTGQDSLPSAPILLPPTAVTISRIHGPTCIISPLYKTNIRHHFTLHFWPFFTDQLQYI